MREKSGPTGRTGTKGSRIQNCITLQFSNVSSRVKRMLKTTRKSFGHQGSFAASRLAHLSNSAAGRFAVGIHSLLCGFAPTSLPRTALQDCFYVAAMVPRMRTHPVGLKPDACRLLFSVGSGALL